ncbi:hypothetical protein ACJ41O_006028 [Fusarium nematophilum]
MGVTGSGKSNFLRLIMGNIAGPEVGHTLDSCTQRTETYQCILGGRRFVFFDTPGFDDTYRGDADILANVAQVLSSSYKNNLKLTGIVYLHRIKDERMTNGIMRNLAMFRNLCGDNAFKNVVLVTTFWDELQDTAKGEDREEQLVKRPDWWGYMTSKGSTTRRFDNTRQSALDIVGELVGLPTVTLQVQEEMVNRGLEVEETTAGEELNRELAEQRATFKKEIEDLRLDREEAERNHDAQLREVFEKMEADKSALLRDIENEQAALHADRREERRRLEQEFSDERLRWNLKFQNVVSESKRIQEELEADARENSRRMRQELEDRIHEMTQEQKAREQRRIEELEKRLGSETDKGDKGLQNALEKSNQVIRDLKKDLRSASAEDRRRIQEAIDDIESRQKDAAESRRRWIKDMDTLNREIRENRLAQKDASDDMWEKLEAKNRELEKKKKAKTGKFWTMIGALAAIASLIVAL